LAIVWIYRRASESALIDTLQNHQNEIQESLREVRDEIGNIEVVVKDPYGSVTAEPNGNDKGFSQRLADLMNKISQIAPLGKITRCAHSFPVSKALEPLLGL
jgi:hypothetical protein